MTIKEMSYEECRKDFFLSLIKHAENKIKYWKRQKGYRCEIEENLSEAGEEISYCQDALNALEKQIPKKPKVIFDEYSYFECANCGEAIYCSDELKSHRYCLNCGQRLDWSDEE